RASRVFSDEGREKLLGCDAADVAPRCTSPRPLVYCLVRCDGELLDHRRGSLFQTLTPSAAFPWRSPENLVGEPSSRAPWHSPCSVSPPRSTPACMCCC